MKSSPPSPNCFKCRFFQVTWEKGRGYACQAMGFKSREIPWRVVLRSSGGPCLSFQAKTGPDSGQSH